MLTPPPKANSGSIQFSLCSAFFLENYITSRGEQRLPRPPNNTEIAQRNSSSLIGAPSSRRRKARETGRSGSLRVKCGCWSPWKQHGLQRLHLPRPEAGCPTSRSQSGRGGCACQCFNPSKLRQLLHLTFVDSGGNFSSSLF